MLKKIGIIVASGSGSRMQSEVPKQFLILKSKPILVITIEKFLDIHDCDVIVALSEDGFIYWENIKSTYALDYSRITVVKGGETRFHSVKNALDSINFTEAVVAVHDAVRPFVSINVIINSFVVAEAFGSAVASVNSKDSVRILEGEENRALDRANVKLIQTPQTFRLTWLKKAYEAEFEDSFTDDASVVEASGEKIRLIEGAYSNIKITTPEDLLLGEIILKKER